MTAQSLSAVVSFLVFARPARLGYTWLALPVKAAVNDTYGAPDVVRIMDVEKPAPKDNELLIKVRATTVNRTDCGFRAAKPFFIRVISGIRKPKITILGSEFAGDVEAVGGGVTSFRPGDRVFGYADQTWGAHAEYMTIGEDGMVATIPAARSYGDVAAGTEGSHYALSFMRSAKVRAGHDVLIYGATGAIGSAAVQIAKSLGANIVAVCDTPNIELVTTLGADRVIDYTASDFTKDEQRYDAVFDAVGKITFGRCRRVLKPHGAYLSSDLGPLSQNLLLALVTRVLPGRTASVPLPRQNREVMNTLRDLIESGDFKPVVDRHYPLDRIVEAYVYVETGRKIGNVVLDVDDPGASVDEAGTSSVD